MFPTAQDGLTFKACAIFTIADTEGPTYAERSRICGTLAGIRCTGLRKSRTPVALVAADERVLRACGVRPPDVRDELRVLDR